MRIRASARLAIPFYLMDDQELFRNFLKPFDLSFKPIANALYARIATQMRARAADTDGRAPDLDVPDNASSTTQEAVL